MNRRGFFAALAAAWLVPRWFKATPTRAAVYYGDFVSHSVSGVAEFAGERWPQVIQWSAEPNPDDGWVAIDPAAFQGIGSV